MDSEPPEAQVYGPVLRIVYGLFRLSGWASAAYWLRKPFTNYERDKETRFFGTYVLVWLVGLVAILRFAPISGNVGLAFAALALYRLQDLLFGTVGDAFRFNRQGIGGSWRSKVMLAVVNIVQIVTIFAIVFLVLTCPADFSPVAPAGRFGHFFLSWSTLPPLGAGFAALTTRTRVLVIIESGTGVVLIVVALSRFLSLTEGTTPAPAADPAAPTVPTPTAPATVPADYDVVLQQVARVRTLMGERAVVEGERAAEIQAILDLIPPPPETSGQA